jgi:RHS repeat-associated protein
VQAKTTHVVLGQYQYDAFGRRVSKIDNFGVQTLFYYDGWRTIEEQSVAGVTQATYVYGNFLDEPLTMNRSGQSFYYHQNSLNTIFALSNSSGNGIEGYSYDAYGYQTIVLPGADGMLWTADDVLLPGGKSSYGNPFLFTAQRYDPETGLLYYKQRYNSTVMGRFFSRDPKEYLDGFNLYAYVGDSPTTTVDPLGLDKCGDPSARTTPLRSDRNGTIHSADAFRVQFDKPPGSDGSEDQAAATQECVNFYTCPLCCDGTPKKPGTDACKIHATKPGHKDKNGKLTTDCSCACDDGKADNKGGDKGDGKGKEKEIKKDSKAKGIEDPPDPKVDKATPSGVGTKSNTPSSEKPASQTGSKGTNGGQWTKAAE